VRNLEYKHQDTAWGRAYDWVCNALTLPTWVIVPVCSLQWCFGDRPAWRWRNLTRLAFRIGTDDGSLYRNGGLYVRFMLPFWIGLHVRWSEHDLFQTSLLPNVVLPVLVLWHLGLGWWPLALALLFLPGWKLIGRPAYHFRRQTDASAQGGLAVGWEDGSK